MTIKIQSLPRSAANRDGVKSCTSRGDRQEDIYLDDEDREAWLAFVLELSRYVVLNPVRAGMVKDLRKWPRSSYQAMTDEIAALAWLKTEGLLGLFSKQRKRAITKYKDFVRAGIGLPSLWTALPKAKPLVYYLAKFDDPKEGMARAYLTGDYTML